MPLERMHGHRDRREPSLRGAPVTGPVLSRRVDRLVIHHSASPRTATVEEIARWHRKRGLQGIGYHHVIGGDGVLRPGRALERTGAHALGYNVHSIGLCVVGDNTRPEHAWLDVQIEALLLYVHWFRTFFPRAEVLGHRDLPGASTLCPGLDVRRLLAQPLRAAARREEPAA